MKVIEEMKKLVEKHVEAYKTDFYNYDLPQIQEAKEGVYIWILRSSGTWLFLKNEASNIYTYCKELDHSVIAFYEVNMKKDTIKKIENPEPLKHFKIIYKNSENVFLKKTTECDAWNREACEKMAQKYMQPEFNYFEVI